MLDVLQCDGDLMSPPTPSCDRSAPKLGDFSSIFSLWNDWSNNRGDGGDDADRDGLDEPVTDSEFDDTSSTAVESSVGSAVLGVTDKDAASTTLPSSASSRASSRSSTPRSVIHSLPPGGLFNGLDFSLVTAARASAHLATLSPAPGLGSYDTADDADDDAHDGSSEDDRSVLTGRPDDSADETDSTLTPRSPSPAEPVLASQLAQLQRSFPRSLGTTEPAPCATLYTPLATVAPLQPYGLFPLGTTSDMILPAYWATSQEKLDILNTKLQAEYEKDRILSNKIPLTGTGPFDKSIHVFVDLSNIVIGFYLRVRTLHNVPPSKRIPAPPFFFHALAQLIERGRPTVRKVTAGSVPDSGIRSGWAPYMDEAEALGYEMNILSRVSRQAAAAAAASSPRRQHGHAPRHRKNEGSSRGNSGWSNWDTSDESAADEAPRGGGGGRGRRSPQKMGEQAVDEILQLKMCHSVLDHDPGTIVLATGDAAEAEFSDGFLRHVERALNRGWRVELVAWKSGISQAWRELKHRQKKEGQSQCFRIIELDTYVEELLGIFKNPSTPNWTN